MPLHFLSKDFEILDFDPPSNPTSHYGACHFGYNNVFVNSYTLHIDFFKEGLEKEELLCHIFGIEGIFFNTQMWHENKK